MGSAQPRRGRGDNGEILSIRQEGGGHRCEALGGSSNNVQSMAEAEDEVV